MTGHLGLGSNVGDRRAHLQAATDALPGHGVTVAAASSVYETEPVGEVTVQPDFLNACLRIATRLGTGRGSLRTSNSSADSATKNASPCAPSAGRFSSTELARSRLARRSIRSS